MSSAQSKSFIVTLKESASDIDVSKIKEGINKLGGEITNEFSLIKGFSCKLPSIHSESLKQNSSIASIEEDQEVKIQN